jgi:hypothetical protein
LRVCDAARGDGHEPPGAAVVHRRDDAAGTVADRADPFDYGIGALDRGEDGFVVVELPGQDRQVRVAGTEPLRVAGVGGDRVAGVESLAYSRCPVRPVAPNTVILKMLSRPRQPGTPLKEPYR